MYQKKKQCNVGKCCMHVWTAIKVLLKTFLSVVCGNIWYLNFNLFLNDLIACTKVESVISKGTLDFCDLMICCFVYIIKTFSGFL